MPNFARLLPALLLFALLVLLPTETRADGVVITGGSFAPTTFGGGPFNFIGAGLNISGGAGFGVNQISCVQCADGSAVTFHHFYSGTDYFTGAGVVDGVSYTRLFYAGTLDFSGSFILTGGAEAFSITSPFTFSGTFSGYLNSVFAGDPGPAVFSSLLTGQGFATLNFAPIFTPNGTRYSLTGIKYNFQDPSAVPEPATLLLLGTGLVGVAARARQRRRKSNS